MSLDNKDLQEEAYRVLANALTDLVMRHAPPGYSALFLAELSEACREVTQERGSDPAVWTLLEQAFHEIQPGRS